MHKQTLTLLAAFLLQAGYYTAAPALHYRLIRQAEHPAGR